MSEEHHDHLSLFESRRALLTGLAYRILGSLAEAEDAVQDTFVKWSQADRRAINNPAAWLTSACTRRCIDLLRAARQVRVDYIGTWLPEPIQCVTENTPERALDLSSSLSMAFLLLLERLAPKERAAYLLHEIFEQPYAQVAAVLGMQETACRKLVSRARINVGRTDARNVVTAQRQETLLAAFQSAIATGATGNLAALMAQDIQLKADGGGKAATLLDPLYGKARVLEFIAGKLSGFWKTYEWRSADINGSRGALLLDGGRISAALSFGFDAHGDLSGIFIMRNPDKLARLSEPEIFLQ
ncbi:RNA polymerase sigma factor SigJ [Pseudomonas sp. EA_35y_Pfl2_R5]|uniref:RNA polymerase sigma factor SigJ n=1 Tax=Pseudomonas sp. EA_35y_Pfl2_R5 TaxID=3088690 RepID=UPI0030DDC156